MKNIKKCMAVILMTVCMLCGVGLTESHAESRTVAINEENFPDDNFREYIKSNCADGRNVLNSKDIKKTKSIWVSYMVSGK